MHVHVTARAALAIAPRSGQPAGQSDTSLGGYVFRRTPLLAVSFAMLLAAPAGAAVPHVVQPGETLWSIAAANNLTTRTVAAFNGLSENSQVVLGSTVMVPSTSEGYASLQKAGLVSSTPSTSSSAAPVASTPAAPPAPLGGYTVRPGDTLSGLAASSRVSVGAIAAMNGLDPNGVLLAGTVIKLPTGAPTPPRAAQPAPAATVVPRSEERRVGKAGGSAGWCY